MFLGEVKIMNDLILAKMREGDWGEVVRLMRAEYGGSPDPAPAAPKDAPREMPFRERFETVRVTPRTVADSVVEENGRFSGITFDGERYKPSRRFLKGLAQRMKVSLSVFDLFSLVIFAVRDIFGYGTLSFPSSTGIDEIVIFPASESSLHPGIFWATVPGALILCMLFLRIILWIQTNITLAGMKQEVENE